MQLPLLPDWREMTCMTALYLDRQTAVGLPSPNALPQHGICVECLEAAAATQRKGSKTPVAERLNMKLSEYFENSKGIGVLATTDLAGK